MSGPPAVPQRSAVDELLQLAGDGVDAATGLVARVEVASTASHVKPRSTRTLIHVNAPVRLVTYTFVPS